MLVLVLFYTGVAKSVLIIFSPVSIISRKKKANTSNSRWISHSFLYQFYNFFVKEYLKGVFIETNFQYKKALCNTNILHGKISVL